MVIGHHLEKGGEGEEGGGGVRLKLDVQRQEGRRFLDVDGQGVWGLENCLDVIRISSLGLVFRE